MAYFDPGVTALDKAVQRTTARHISLDNVIIRDICAVAFLTYQGVLLRASKAGSANETRPLSAASMKVIRSDGQSAFVSTGPAGQIIAGLFPACSESMGASRHAYL